jgi:hypothetical protein
VAKRKKKKKKVYIRFRNGSVITVKGGGRGGKVSGDFVDFVLG